MNSNRPELSPEEKKDLFLLCFIQEKGHITKACHLVGVHRKTYYYWINEDKEFAAKVEDLQGEDTDEIIKALKILAKGQTSEIPDIDDVLPSLPAIKYYLEHKGKNDGFGKTGKDSAIGQSALPGGDFHLHLHSPPEPKTLAEWEEQVFEAREKRRLLEIEEKIKRGGGDNPEDSEGNSVRNDVREDKE